MFQLHLSWNFHTVFLSNAMSIEDTRFEQYISANRGVAISKYRPFPNSVAFLRFATSFSTSFLLLSGALFQCQTVSTHQKNFGNSPDHCRRHEHRRNASVFDSSALLTQTNTPRSPHPLLSPHAPLSSRRLCEALPPTSTASRSLPSHPSQRTHGLAASSRGHELPSHELE